MYYLPVAHSVSSSSSSTFTTCSSASSSSSTAFAFPFPLSLPFLSSFPSTFSITCTASFPFPFLLPLPLPLPFFVPVPSPCSDTLCGLRLLETGATVSSSSTSIDDPPASSNFPCEYASRLGAVKEHCCFRSWQCSQAKRGGPLSRSTKLRHAKPLLMQRGHLGHQMHVGHPSCLFFW